ncbi:MAG: acetylornithine transaminase [Planctomycetota bacterium]
MSPESPILSDHRVPNYKRSGLVFDHGEGCRLHAADGTTWLDFLSGIGVNALGHGHPALVEALRDQAGRLLHVSNIYDHPLSEQVAACVAEACGLDLVFFSNSGTEAMECALKLARRWQRAQGKDDRTRFLALESSFHGRTFGALSITWNEAYRAPFAPLVPGVDFVPAGDVAALEAALATGTHAALVLEPIQGESGVLPLAADYLRAARELTERHGALLVTDEIQCGSGRTGTFLFGQQAGIVPDVVTLAKPLAGGLPLGATVARREVGECLVPGDHGSTYGGGPLVCRAALVFLTELFDRGLLGRVAEAGARFAAGLDALVARSPRVAARRGHGLMQALVLEEDAAPIYQALLDRRLLVNACGKRVLRFLPPYVVTDDELDEGLAILAEVLDPA